MEDKKHHAVQKVIESDLFYRTIFNQSRDGILIIDTDGAFIEFNESAHRQLGYSREEFKKLRISDIDSIQDPDEIRASIKKIIDTGSAEFEVTHRAKDGKIRHVHVITQLMTISGQALFHTIWRDITEQKAAETRVRESENKFRFFFDQANDGIMIADTEQKKNIEANKAICAMLGYTRDEIVELSIADMHPKEEILRILDLFEQQVRGEISIAPDVPMLKKDGSIIYADINSVRRMLNGRSCLIGVFRDITERKKMETSLRARERQLAESQRIAHVGSWEHNLTTDQVFWSDELVRLLGRDPKKDPGAIKMFFDIIHPDDQPAVKKGIDDTVRLNIPFNVEYRFILKNGTTRILHAQAELIHDDTGMQNILRGTAQDITERKLAEIKIHQSEEFIRSILDTVDEGFIVIDRDFRILTANKAYCNQVGGISEEIIGKHCYEVSHKSSRPCSEEGEDCPSRHVFETGKPYAALHKHTNPKGMIMYVETKSFPIKDSSGAVTSVIETISNITERYLLEEERLKTQKLESIGTLAGGIAHDFNNLLQGIFGYISMAKMTHDQKEKSLAMLEQAEKALHQSVNLTTQLLTFSKGGKPVTKLLDLRPVIENSTKFMLSGSRSDFRMNIPEDLWQTEADAGQVGQVIQNIVLNADQSMPTGGSVVVTAKNVAADDASLPHGLSRGNYVMISILDTGIGIPEKYLSKIFDPYFTTKEKGSGLGLATSYSIIRNHGGMIDIRTKPGEGSTFMIYLPAIVGEGKTASPAKPTEPSLTRTARVLVMDDEEIIQNLSRELLLALGQEAEVAKHGQDALEKYRGAMDAGKPFDVVILDLTVRGGMGGAETLQRLLKIDPAVKAVVSSGYSDDAVIAGYQQEGFKAVLKKPYNVNELQDVLNKLLG